MTTWTIIDSETDQEVGTVRYEGYLDYLGSDFAVEELVQGLDSDEDSFPGDLDSASGGRYVAVPDEGYEAEAEAADPGDGADLDADDEAESLAESDGPLAPAWEAVFTEGDRPLGRLLGDGGRAELDVQDPALHGSLLVDVLPAIEALGLEPYRAEYRDALRTAVEGLSGRTVRVEFKETYSIGGNQGGDLPNAVVRYGSSSPDWGGPAAPWAPVPLEPARKYIKANPDAAIEVNFPTVFEEDRSAKIRDLLQGDLAGFITHRRAAEQYAKEMGFEQFDYDQEQETIGTEKPKAATVQGLAQEMAGPGGGSPGAPASGGLPGMKGVAGQSKPAGVDGPGRNLVRAKVAPGAPESDHAFKLEQGALAETERRARLRERRGHEAAVLERVGRQERATARLAEAMESDRRVAEAEQRATAAEAAADRRAAETERRARVEAEESDRRHREEMRAERKSSRESLRRERASKTRLKEQSAERERADRRLLEAERVSADRLAAQRPEIKVEAPRVEVHPPAITVEAAHVEVHPPAITVNLPKPTDKKVVYDSEGRATGLTSAEG